MTHVRSQGTTTVGYHLALPAGWIHIPLGDDTKDALDHLLFSRLKDVPSEVPVDKRMAYRLRLRRAIEEQIAAASEANGLDLYLPLETHGWRYGIPLAASFLVTEFHASDSDPSPEVLLSHLAAATDDEATSETLELADTLAVRREYVRADNLDEEESVQARHVDYALKVPYDPDSYIAVSFSTAGDGDPDSEFSHAAAELFDAVMTTFQWMYADESTPEPAQAENT